MLQLLAFNFELLSQRSPVLRRCLADQVRSSGLAGLGLRRDGRAALDLRGHRGQDGHGGARPAAFKAAAAAEDGSGE